MSNVPVIDLSLPEVEAAAAVRAACTSSGFFYVASHGVPQELVDEVFNQQQRLFSLPVDVKQTMSDFTTPRGWMPFNKESLDPENQSAPDMKECFHLGQEIAADSPEAKRPLHGPNVWPSTAILPCYKTVTMDYFNAMNALGRRLIRLLALALDLDATYFDSYFQPAMTQMRPMHYPGLISKPAEGKFGAGAHCDYGVLTILATDDVPGLQIYPGDKTSSAVEPDLWEDVLPIPGTFIINLGDMLERWTNGMFKSTLHRVVSTSGKDRYSIPFFIGPGFDAQIECLPVCCSEERPAQYLPTNFGQYLMNKFVKRQSEKATLDRQM